jgi:2'-5' RNA ligase
MGLAVELYFDTAAEQTIRQIRQTLTNAGIPPILDALGGRPHISPAGFPGDDATPLLPQIETFAQTAGPFVVTLSAIGVFPTLAGVLFLAPTPTQTLLARHRHLHELVATTPLAINPSYRPEVWVPHCTLATDLQPAQIAAAVEVCMQAFTPFPVTCCEVGLIRFRPVRSIHTYALRGG